MSDCLSRFADAIYAEGMTPPDRIVPGKIHRFPGRGKKKGNTAGWCWLAENTRRGVIGDWSRDFRKIWSCHGGDKHIVLQYRHENCHFRNKRHINIEHSASFCKAAEKAWRIWQNSQPASRNHPYVRHKAIRPYSARQLRNRLVLPITDFHFRIISLQFVDPEGSKRLLKGGKKQGCFISVRGFQGDCDVETIICEGWATGCTLAEMFPEARILAAIDAGNLAPVAVSARLTWPRSKLTIAADDDRKTPGNPGLTAARNAAAAAAAEVISPEWPADAPDDLSDFNDLMKLLLSERMK